MAIVAGVIHVSTAENKEGANQYIEPTYSRNFTLTLDKDATWLVGIDQSTSCTGFFIRDLQGKYKILVDFKRVEVEKADYFRELKGFIHETFSPVNVSLIVHEEPVPNQNQRYSGHVLQELKGSLKEWIREIPSLQKTEVFGIYPQSWKSRVVSRKNAELAGQTFKDRCKKKAFIAWDLCQIYPYFKQYMNYKFSEDYDAFDACGILSGYLSAAYDSQGHRCIYGLKEKSHTSFVGYKYVDRAELLENIHNEYYFADQLEGACYAIDPVFLLFNNEYNKQDNIRMASSNWDAVVTILPEKQLGQLEWQFNFEKDPNKVMLMYVFRKNKIRSTVFSGIEDAFEWKEEIKG